MNKNNVFIGILTCNRPNLFQKTLSSILSSIHQSKSNFRFSVCIVNTGDDIRSMIESIVQYGQDSHPTVLYYKAPGNLNIAQAKNILIKEFVKSESAFLFLVEDDVEILNCCFEKYLETSIRTRIPHLLCGSIGPTFKGPLEKIRCIDPVKQIHFYKACVGVFNFFTRDIILKIGLMCENFRNAMEHCEYSLRVIRLGYFRKDYYPDILNSENFIRDLDPHGINSYRNKIQSKEDTKYSLKLYEDLFRADSSKWNKQFYD